MILVETEGSYTNQITLDSLDVHVGQSYSVLVPADANETAYYIVASPKLLNNAALPGLVGVGLLHYAGCNYTKPLEPFSSGPDPFDIDFSLSQAKSIR